MFEHIANDIWQVILRNKLFLVAKLGNAFRNLLCLLRREVQAKLFKVTRDIGTSAIFSESILALTSETLWHKVVTIEVVLVVAISMNASHLRKHILTHDRLVGRNCNATITFNQSAYRVKLTFINSCFGMKLVFQNNLNA